MNTASTGDSELDAILLKLGVKEFWSGYETTDEETAREYHPDIAEAKAALLKWRDQEVAAELEDRLHVIEGLGSKGDKVHGDPKFMMGIEAVEDHLKYRIAELRTAAARLGQEGANA